MNVGYNIVKDFKRPDKQLIDCFKDIPVPNIGDAMNRTAAISSSIRPFNKNRIQGSAYTVRTQAGDNLLIYYAIDNAKPGDVIVIDGNGFLDRALLGGIMSTYAAKRGIAGIVVDGAIRDPLELEKLDINVFAKSISPNGPYKNGPGEINVPVNIGGRIINPGDIIIGDYDGLIVIEPSCALEVLKKSKQVVLKEAKMMKQIQEEGKMDLAWMYEKLEKDACDFK